MLKNQNFNQFLFIYPKHMESILYSLMNPFLVPKKKKRDLITQNQLESLNFLKLDLHSQAIRMAKKTSSNFQYRIELIDTNLFNALDQY